MILHTDSLAQFVCMMREIGRGTANKGVCRKPLPSSEVIGGREMADEVRIFADR